MRQLRTLKARHIFIPTGEEEHDIEVWDDRRHTGLLARLTYDEAVNIVNGSLKATDRHGLEDLTDTEQEQLRRCLIGDLQLRGYPRFDG